MCVVVVVVIVHWHCSAQLSMFNMEKRYRNKIIIIVITGTDVEMIRNKVKINRIFLAVVLSRNNVVVSYYCLTPSQPIQTMW